MHLALRRSLPVLALTCLASSLALGQIPVPNRTPLQPTPFIPLDLGSVKPLGWLENQLQLQADGLTGHAEEVIPELGPENGWRGGNGESWEKGPYYLRGLVSLAYVRNDPKLKRQALKWIDWLLENQAENGQLGPASSNDWWPRMIITWTLRDYFEATQDPRVIPALTRYAHFMRQRLPDQPLEEWAKARAGDQIDTLFWLYNRTGDTELLELVDLLRGQANQWNSFYRTMRGSPGDFRITHGVNVSQAMKFPVVNWERTGDAEDRKVFEIAWKNLTEQHGLPVGMWSGTEPLASHSTTQGVEMCSIVEQMLSSEVALGALGDPAIGDQLERIAFNLLPGGTTEDFKQFQYFTLPNAPMAIRGKPGELPFGDDHGDDLLLSPHSGFHCCCYNLHMGWPKYVQHAWMATQDGGLAAVAYGPTKVTTQIRNTAITLTEETNYPFEDVVRIKVSPTAPVEFPLQLRIPGWSDKPRVAVNGQFVENMKPGEFLTLDRTWKAGDTVVAEFPAKLKTENAFNGSAALWRGPLVFSLQIEQEQKTVTRIRNGFDEIEMTPATPWNYALDIDRNSPAEDIKFKRAKMPINPWIADTTPIQLTVPAKRLPKWKLRLSDRLAEEVPPSPVASDEPLESVTLVPFGTQTLRMTAFPLLRGSAILQPGITASHHHDSLNEILTNSTPKSSLGSNLPRFTFWDHTGTEEWIDWTFDQSRTVSSLSVYWFDDTATGGRCRIPDSWKLSYQKNGEWIPVPEPTEFSTEKDQSNSVSFSPVETTALRLKIKLQPNFSAGVLQLKN